MKEKRTKQYTQPAVVLGILVTVGALILIGIYGKPASDNTPQSQQAASLDIQQQCASDAKDFFNNFETNPSASNNWAQAVTGSGGQLSYSDHYNVSLGKCLILINGTEYKTAPRTGGYYSLTWLYDVNENKLLASMNADSESSFNICVFPASKNLDSKGFPKECGNQEAFEAAVQNYMSN